MKKTLMTLFAVSCLSLSLYGCPSPNAGGVNPGGTGTGASGPLASKAAFVAYLNCAKAKYPQAAASIDASIAGLNNVSDAQWAAAIAASGGASYNALLQLYASLGC